MIEQAVILADVSATGENGEVVHPQQALLGLTMLERIILTLGHGGIQRILVLGRGISSPLLPENDDRLKRSGVTLQWIKAGEAGALLPQPQDPFLLLCGTVALTADFVRWIKELQAEKNWLLTPAGKGDRLKPSFSGLAVCQAGMFPLLLAHTAGAVRAQELDVLFIPADSEAKVVPGHDWVWVDSARSIRQARRLLRRSMGKASDGFFSRHLNRHISWPISKWLIRLRIRPTQVTVANLALGLLSGWLIGRGGYGRTLGAGLLFQFVSILDGCDGEIARLTFRFSAWGTRLDNLCDFVTLIAFFINLPIGLYAASGDFSFLVLGGLLIVVLAFFYLALLFWIKLSRHRGNIAELVSQVQAKGKSGVKLSWMDGLGVRLGFIFRKEFISLYAMAWCLVDRADVFLWSLIVLAPLAIVFLIYTMFRLKRGVNGCG